VHKCVVAFNSWYIIVGHIILSYKEILDGYRHINQPGEASDVLNSFHQAFHDIEYVDLNGVHFILCGSEV